MSISLITLILLCIFLGALMRATFGFGDAVVSMPLLALLPIDFTLAISLVGLSGLTVAAMSAPKGIRNIDTRVLTRLGVATILGVPAGIWLVLVLPERFVMFALGLFLVFYSIYSLIRKNRTPFHTRQHPWAYVFGFLSGLLGSAYNFNGVPVVIYATLCGWSAEKFRSTLQAHFLISGALVVTGQALGGFWTMDLLLLFGLLLPVLALAAVVGEKLYSIIPAHRFALFVYVLIFLLGLVLLVKQ